ncbi:MAG: tight adherence protein [Micromonosporaceae bacterium]
MTGNLTLTLAVLLGGGFGAGMCLVALGVMPGPPALRATLQRLRSAPAPVSASAGAASGRLAVFAVPRRELALLGRSVEGYIASKIAYVLLGMAVPALLGALLWAARVSLPIYFPAGGSVLLGAVFYVVVDVDLRQKATRARREFRYAVCAFLDGVALERAVGRGPVESLERPAKVGKGWVFERIRDAMARATWDQRAPWDALRKVSDEIGVPVLGEIGDIMRLSGEEGAQVYDTLRSLADGLRNEILADELAQANAQTTILAIPSTALLAVLFGLGAYPLIARLLFT